MKAGVKYERKKVLLQKYWFQFLYLLLCYILSVRLVIRKKVIQQVTATAGIQAVTVLSQQPEVDRPITAVRRKIQPEQATQRKIIPEQAVQRKTIHTIHTMMVMMIYTWMTIMIMTGIIKTAIMLMA